MAKTTKTITEAQSAEDLNAEFESIVEAQEEPKEDEYVMVARRVDRFNVIRKLVKRTPVTCSMHGCGWDALNANFDIFGTYDYDSLSDVEKALCQRALRDHMDVHATNRAMPTPRANIPRLKTTI